MSTYYNVNREIVVLKTIIFYATKEISTWLLARVQEDHFGYLPNKEIWNRIKFYLTKGYELPSSSTFKEDPTFSLDAINILSGDVSPVLTLTDAITSFNILEEYRLKRGFFETLTTSSELLNKDTDIKENIETLHTNLLKLQAKQSDLEIINTGFNSNDSTIIKDILDSAPEILVPTGITKFDNLSGGWAKGDLVALVGPSGGGKSLLAQQILLNQYQMGYNVCLVSFEMREIEIYQRILANICDINHTSIKRHQLTDKEKINIKNKWELFTQHGETSNCRLSIINPKQELTASQISSLLKPFNYDCVFIDYLSLIAHTTGNTEAERLGNSARQFKIGAIANNTVIVILAQYNEEKKRIKYSTAIKDHVSFLWQWEYGESERELGQTEIYQNKTRNAEQFKIPMLTDFAKSKWINGDTTSTYTNSNVSIQQAPTMLTAEEIYFGDSDL